MPWDGALALASYLWQSRYYDSVLPAPLSKPLTVLEIGAGCGLPSIVAALAYGGATVVATDVPAMVPLLHCNVTSNAASLAHAGSHLVAAPLLWGGAFHKLWKAAGLSRNTVVDVLLAADVVGVGEGVHTDALLKTLTDAAHTNPDLLVLLAHRRRADSEADFFDALASCGWRVTNVARYAGAAVRALHACVQRRTGTGTGTGSGTHLEEAGSMLEACTTDEPVDILLLSPLAAATSSDSDTFDD